MASQNGHADVLQLLLTENTDINLTNQVIRIAVVVVVVGSMYTILCQFVSLRVCVCIHQIMFIVLLFVRLTIVFYKSVNNTECL